MTPPVSSQCAEKWIKNDKNLWSFTYLGVKNNTHNFMCEVCKEVLKGQKIHLQNHVNKTKKHKKNIEQIIRNKVEKRRARRK